MLQVKFRTEVTLREEKRMRPKVPNIFNEIYLK